MNTLQCPECGSSNIDTSDTQGRDYGDQAALWCDDCGECFIAQKVDPKKVFSEE